MAKKILIVVAVVLGLAIFLLARDWHSPELGQRILDEVGEATGVRITAEGFRLNVLRGVELHGVSGSQVSESRELSFSLDQLLFEHRILPLLSGTVAVERVVLEGPRIEITDSPAAAASGQPRATEDPALQSTPAPEGEGGLSLEVQEIAIRNGVVILREKGEEGETRIEGLDLSMEDVAYDASAQSLAAISARGNLSVREILFDTLKLTETKSRFQLESARFDMPELSFTTPYGPFGAALKVDFNSVPFDYTLTATGDPLDLNALVSASEGFGPGVVQLDAEGSGPESKDLKAQGQVELAEGRFPQIAMFADVDKALGKNVLAGRSYEATTASFRLENDVLTLAPFRFESDDARLDLAGTVNLAGPLALELAVATPREGLRIDGVGSNVLDVMADDAGWVPVPVTIAGTLEQPRVRPDTGALLAQAGAGAKREAVGAATDALRGLIRKKND